jgi:hypothetical protein
VTRLADWAGRLLCAGGLVAWLGWLGWRISSPPTRAIGIAAFGLELLAFATAFVVTAGLWNARSARERASGHLHGTDGTGRALPQLMSQALGLADAQMVDRSQTGADDTGEVAWARLGLGFFGAPRSRKELDKSADSTPARRRVLPSPGEAAWAVVATDGLRKMLFVGVLVAVLFSGDAPFEVPSVEVAAMLVGAMALLALGHWVLSGGLLLPGSRTMWSMASVGAGFGDGNSRTGLPIRWMATIATMVVLNLSISLRGLSDRWTHGLEVMPRDERVLAMSAAFALVTTGFLALRTLEQPDLGFYGATRRLEEGSARRLALGATVGIALLGFFVGVLPAGTPA